MVTIFENGRCISAEEVWNEEGTTFVKIGSDLSVDEVVAFAEKFSDKARPMVDGCFIPDTNLKLGWIGRKDQEDPFEVVPLEDLKEELYLKFVDLLPAYMISEITEK